jgi:hypothetical protein
MFGKRSRTVDRKFYTLTMRVRKNSENSEAILKEILADLAEFNSLATEPDNLTRICNIFPNNNKKIIEYVLKNSSSIKNLITRSLGDLRRFIKSNPDYQEALLDSFLEKPDVLEKLTLRNLYDEFPNSHKKINDALLSNSELLRVLVKSSLLSEYFSEVVNFGNIDSALKEKLLDKTMEDEVLLETILANCQYFEKLLIVFSGREEKLMERLIDNPIVLKRKVRPAAIFVNPFEDLEKLIKQFYPHVSREKILDRFYKTEYGKSLIEPGIQRIAEIHHDDEIIFQSMRSVLRESLAAATETESKEDTLAINFNVADQERYNAFWKQQLPMLANQFLEACKNENYAGLAEKLYKLVAQERRNIATELGTQSPPGSNFTYGDFRDKKEGAGRFVDNIFPGDPRFGRYHEAMVKSLDHYENKRCVFVEELVSEEYQVQQVVLSDSYIIKLPNRNPIFYDPLGGPEIRVDSFAYGGKTGVLTWHVKAADINIVFHRLDSLVHDVLNLKVDSGSPEKLWFLLGTIMWYLGNLLPLKAGSAATTENFIKAILLTKSFSDENFKLINDIPWYFAVKIMSKAEFVKNFPQIFKKIPRSLTLDNGEENIGQDSSNQLVGKSPKIK